MVVLVGIMMSVTPGPTIIAIPGGLALLATGIPWVQKRLDRMKDTISKHTRGRRTGALGDGGSKQ